MNETIKKIYQTRSVTGKSGQVHQLHSEIDPGEGEFLFSVIRDDPKIKRTLEVGCAYGLSSLHICSATRDRPGASHTMIDPFQNTQWDGVGVANLNAAGIDFYHLVEKKSEFALPELLQGQEGGFDFIFVDGWHTFDHTLIDCFYATRLLRVGGILAIDDLTLPAVRDVVDFLKHYPCYEEIRSVTRKKRSSLKRAVVKTLALPIGRRTWSRLLAPKYYRGVFEDSSTRMIALRKVQEDTRDWNWHVA